MNNIRKIEQIVDHTQKKSELKSSLCSFLNQKHYSFVSMLSSEKPSDNTFRTSSDDGTPLMSL